MKTTKFTTIFLSALALVCLLCLPAQAKQDNDRNNKDPHQDKIYSANEHNNHGQAMRNTEHQPVRNAWGHDRDRQIRTHNKNHAPKDHPRNNRRNEPIIPPVPDPVVPPAPDPVIVPEPDPVVTPTPDPVIVPEPDPVTPPPSEPPPAHEPDQVIPPLPDSYVPPSPDPVGFVATFSLVDTSSTSTMATASTADLTTTGSITTTSTETVITSTPKERTPVIPDMPF